MNAVMNSLWLTFDVNRIMLTPNQVSTPTTNVESGSRGMRGQKCASVRVCAAAAGESRLHAGDKAAVVTVLIVHSAHS